MKFAGVLHCGRYTMEIASVREKMHNWTKSQAVMNTAARNGNVIGKKKYVSDLNMLETSNLTDLFL